MASCQAQYVAERAMGSVLLLYITGYLVHSLSDIEGEFSWVENICFILLWIYFYSQHNPEEHECS